MGDYVERYGAWRCAEILAARLGIRVTGPAVEQLAAAGLIADAGMFESWQMYDVASLAAVTLADAEQAQAAADAAGLLNRREARRYLGIRQSEFDLLVEVGMLVPDRRQDGKWQGEVLLFRRDQLDGLMTRPDIDWAAVRAVKRGQPSQLAAIAETERILLVLGGMSPPRVRQR